MTFEVEFHEEHAALWHVRYSLENFPDHTIPFAYLAQGSACILCCASALEAIVNKIFQYSNPISTWDELRILSKITTLHELKGEKIDWGSQPWQDITKLIKLRNWLAHNKEAYIGLSNSDGQWVGKIPQINPEVDLDKRAIEKMYNSVRQGGFILATLWNLESSFDFLKNEKYAPLIS